MSDRIKSEQRRKDVAARVALPCKSALTRAEIMETASRFLQDRPFRELKIGVLMADVGLSRPTYYQYFNDLHGLMEALLDEVKSGIIEGAQPWLARADNPVADLQASLAALVDVGYRHGTILKALADAAPHDARLEQVWESFLGAFDEVVAARISQDQSSGLTPDFDPFPVARALNRMDAAVLIRAFGHPRKQDRQDVLNAITRIWLSTLYPFDAKAAIARGPQ